MPRSSVINMTALRKAIRIYILLTNKTDIYIVIINISIARLRIWTMPAMF